MIKKIASISLVFLIEFYQAGLSPFMGGKHCKFHPSCSEYAKEAIQTYGLRKGIYKSIRRLLRCHPFSKGKYDPV